MLYYLLSLTGFIQVRDFVFLTGGQNFNGNIHGEKRGN